MFSFSKNKEKDNNKNTEKNIEKKEERIYIYSCWTGPIWF